MVSRFHHIVLLGAIFAASACAYTPPEPFTEALVLGGEEVHPDVLNLGQEAYGFYCQACHGRNGDGRGPSAANLETPPRDFRIATYKFSGVANGLPGDEDLARIVRNGLHGTAMLPWKMPEETLKAVIQYIKTFSPEAEGWREEGSTKNESVKADLDPWAGKEKAALARGEAVYHGIVTCYLCHPSYVTTEKINAHRGLFSIPPQDAYRPNIWMPVLKASDSYSRPLAGDPACERSKPCKDEAHVCRYGRCEEKINILPPDFTFNPIRNGRSTAEIFRTIASGIPGTAMPAWKDGIPDKDIWAVANYIKHLMSLRGTDKAYQLRDRVKADSIASIKKAEAAAAAAEEAEKAMQAEEQ